MSYFLTCLVSKQALFGNLYYKYCFCDLAAKEKEFITTGKNQNYYLPLSKAKFLESTHIAAFIVLFPKRFSYYFPSPTCRDHARHCAKNLNEFFYASLQPAEQGRCSFSPVAWQSRLRPGRFPDFPTVPRLVSEAEFVPAGSRAPSFRSCPAFLPRYVNIVPP